MIEKWYRFFFQIQIGKKEEFKQRKEYVVWKIGGDKYENRR